MQIQPDFSESLDSLPAGEYPTRVTDCAVKTSKEGNQYLNWTLETFGKTDDRMNGRKIFHSTPIRGRGAGILKSFIKATTGQTEITNFDTEDYMGKELVVVLVENPNSDFPQVKSVKSYMANVA